MLLSRFKLREHDPEGAEQVLQKAVAIAPQSAPASLALGALYLRLDKTDLAQAQFLKTLALDPKYAPGLLSLAQLQVRRHDLDGAEQTFHRLALLQDAAFKEYRPLYGRFLFARGKRDAALAEFQRLAKEDPADRAARTRVVTAYLSMKREPEAKKILTDALKHNANDTDALLQQGEMLLRSGDLTGAEKDFNLVLKATPDSAEAHFALAKVRHAKGDLPMVEVQELNQALVYRPDYLAARVALCEKYVQTKQFQAALDLMDRTPAAQKNSSVVAVARNWALMGLGKTREAREGVDRGLAARRVPDLVAQDGILKLNAKDFQGARADAEEILRHDPEDPRAVGILVDSYAGQKELAKAAQRLAEMVAQHPQSGKLRTMLGQVLIDSGDEAGGRKQYEAAEAAAPGLPAPKLALARIDFKENRLDAARQRINGLIALEPRNIEALALAGEIEWKAGNRPGAIARYRSVVEIDGSNVRGLTRLALLTAVDKPDEALKFAQKALEIAPQSGEVEDTLGWLYYRGGVYSTATEYLKMAVASEPTPRHQFHLAMSCLKGGDQALGQSMLVAALNKDPDLPKKEQGW